MEWMTRALILLTIGAQVLSALCGSQPVFLSHCGHHDDDHPAADAHCDPGCDPSSCLAVLGHEHEEHVAPSEDGHRCHCHHFHFRGEAQRFERGRLGEVVRKHPGGAAVLPGATLRDLVPGRHAERPCPDALATAPPSQGLVAIRSVRLVV
jgi:hypothetical protein